MGGFLERVKRAFADDRPKRYSVAGVEVRCPHCGGQEFDSGHVDWFAAEVERLDGPTDGTGTTGG
jgi:hypothetical protein